MRACVHACMRACVHACMRACKVTDPFSSLLARHAPFQTTPTSRHDNQLPPGFELIDRSSCNACGPGFNATRCKELVVRMFQPPPYTITYCKQACGCWPAARGSMHSACACGVKLMLPIHQCHRPAGFAAMGSCTQHPCCLHIRGYYASAPGGPHTYQALPRAPLAPSACRDP
jgi:hypothetical protein